MRATSRWHRRNTILSKTTRNQAKHEDTTVVTANPGTCHVQISKFRRSADVLDEKIPHTHSYGYAHEKHGVDFLNGPTFASNGQLWSKLRFRYVPARPVVHRRRNYELAPSFCITPSVGIAWNRSQVVFSMQIMGFHESRRRNEHTMRKNGLTPPFCIAQSARMQCNQW